MIAARKSWLMAYDNITSLPGWLSNGLCGLSTGTGFTIRSLGTDDEEIIFVAQRPIIINGINDFVEKADLGDRSFFLHLPRISRSSRRTEEAFWADFDRDCPLILGGLLDAVSAGMRVLPDVQLVGAVASGRCRTMGRSRRPRPRLGSRRHLPTPSRQTARGERIDARRVARGRGLDRPGDPLSVVPGNHARTAPDARGSRAVSHGPLRRLAEEPASSVGQAAANWLPSFDRSGSMSSSAAKRVAGS